MTRPRAKSTFCGELAVAGLPAKQTDPTESEISKLEVTVLVDEQIIWFKITR